MADYYFHLDSLTVGYNGKPLISDIEIGINQGEIVTLIGPNGAGKSTILKSITRQLSIVSGKVHFDGKEIREYSYRDLSCKMAVVLTERMRPELMTCHDIVATGRYPYTGRLGILSREDEQKVEDAMRAVHAEELGSRDFNAISDGQRQRVLLARAICQEPDIILLDEPTSFLDIRHKLELLAILRQMAKAKNITVIMSLHEIDLAMKISDRILCIKGDHIFKEGTPDEVFEEELIRELYSIDNGFFDPLFGSIELPKPGKKSAGTGTGETAGAGETVGAEEMAGAGETVGAEETAGADWEAKTLVLSSCGTGIPVYRRLQKENTPFIAGILYKNDMDYRLARLLADRVIAEEPFETLSEKAVAEALDAVKKCERVIDAGVTIGTGNHGMERVLEAARQAGKLEKAWEKTPDKA